MPVKQLEKLLSVYWRYLPTDDLLVIKNESVGHIWGQFDGLQPEAHVAFFQNLIVQTMFQWHNCKEAKDM